MSPFAFGANTRVTFSPVNYGRPLTNQFLPIIIENLSVNKPLSMETNIAAIGERGMPTILPEGIASLKELERFATDHQLFLYMTVAMLTLLLHDYFLTFNMEVTYIWKARPKITLTNCLFFVNRYLPILRAFAFTIFSFYPSSDQVICDRWIDFNSYCTMINVATGELLMFLRTWALWNQSRRIGAIMFGFFVVALAAVIAITRPSIPPAAGVVPLPPPSVLFCDRPSPYKYLYVYCVALVVEFTCVSFMFGRIMYITNFSKVPPKLQSRRTTSKPTIAALPLIRTLQRHGAYYFAAVICVIILTVISSFVRPLARTIINAGVAPSITSIACNRVIFALRGLYLDPGDDFSRATMSRDIKTRDGARFSEEFAETRRELTTARDLDLNNFVEDGKGGTEMESKLRSLPRLGHNDQSHSQQPTPKPLTGGKGPRLKLHFRSHDASSSSVMTSDESTGHGRNTSHTQPPPVPAKDPAKIEEMARRSNHLHHGARGTSKSSSKYQPGPESASSHATTAASPTSPTVGSLKRSLSGMMNVASPINRSSGPSVVRPTLEDDLIKSGLEPEGDPSVICMQGDQLNKGLSERLGTMWGKRKGRRPEDAVDHNASYGEELSGERSTPKPRERHPLDHHYEMETIRSDILNNEVSGSDHDTNMSRLTLDSSQHDPGGNVRQRDLESGVFRGHEAQELSPIMYSSNIRANTYLEEL